MHLFWFRASEATDPEHCDAFLSVPCFLMPQKFVIDFVEVLTEIENFGGIHNSWRTL